MQHEVTLSRGDIRLRPLTADDGPALRAIVDDDSWQGMSAPLPASDEDMSAHLQSMTDRPGLLAFAVQRGGEFVGRTTLYDVVEGLKAEIGNTIYARSVWGSEVNPTCKLLLGDYAVEKLGVHRLALRCDHRNTRSRRAILRLGAQFEGTLRAFRPAADGTIADVDYFSILRSEWPTVRAGLLERLGAS